MEEFHAFLILPIRFHYAKLANMEIQFTKMQGLGNDFVVIDCTNQNIEITPEIVRKLANRRFGVGCDQVLLVEPPKTDKAVFGYRIFNQDGGEVSQCGNGARCFARFVTDKELTDLIEIPVETNSGLLVLKLTANGMVEVNMGIAEFSPSKIPFVAVGEKGVYSLSIGANTITGSEDVDVSVLALGNPHAVLVVDDVENMDIAGISTSIQQNDRFPEGVNVGFMQILNRNLVQCRIYERGAGETLACGSGACAAVVAGIRLGLLENQVKVRLHGGKLDIMWQGDGEPIIMTGPADTVFEGTIKL